MEFLWEGVMAITPQQFVMYLIGGLLIWLAVKKEYEPALLLPMGFGAIMVNLPLSGVINQVTEGIGETQGIIQWLFETTISASEALPILLFIGIGAMIDFGPLLSQPIMFLFGAAAQFGIFFAICVASLMGFELRGCSVDRNHRCGGWTDFHSGFPDHAFQLCGCDRGGGVLLHGVGANHPAICDPSGDDEKRTPDSHDLQSENVSKTTKIAFPIVVTIIVGLISPASVALVGFLMFGNLIRECGVLPALSQTAQNELANLITLLLGITISFSMRADAFVRVDTLRLWESV